MSKHTPGPWESDRAAVYSTSDALKERRVFGYGFGDNGFICDLDDGEYHEYSDYGEMQANSRLIAAAPEMLEALEKVHHSMTEQIMSGSKEYMPNYNTVSSAIKKAKGDDV